MLLSSCWYSQSPLLVCYVSCMRVSCFFLCTLSTPLLDQYPLYTNSLLLLQCNTLLCPYPVLYGCGTVRGGSLLQRYFVCPQRSWYTSPPSHTDSIRQLYMYVLSYYMGVSSFFLCTLSTSPLDRYPLCNSISTTCQVYCLRKHALCCAYKIIDTVCLYFSMTLCSVHTLYGMGVALYGVAVYFNDTSHAACGRGVLHCLPSRVDSTHQLYMYVLLCIPGAEWVWWIISVNVAPFT